MALGARNLRRRKRRAQAIACRAEHRQARPQVIEQTRAKGEVVDAGRCADTPMSASQERAARSIGTMIQEDN
ncbi:MAG: hypothetical protein U0074_08570 [Kouleothrix sp.]